MEETEGRKLMMASKNLYCPFCDCWAVDMECKRDDGLEEARDRGGAGKEEEEREVVDELRDSLDRFFGVVLVLE